MLQFQGYGGRRYRTGFGIIILVIIFITGIYPVSGQFVNRVWDQNKNTGTDYTWNSYNFPGFYYDLDDDIATEELTIQNIGRTIAAGDIIYKTSPIEINFNYSGFGKYMIIGFMADRYFAGYTSNSVISDNTEINTIGNAQLQRVLFDDEDKRVVYQGGTLTLGEGYVLKLKEIDVGAGPRQVWFTLLKDGTEVDNGVVGAGNTYVYSKNVGSVNNLPILAVRIDSVFSGGDLNAAFVKGLFQISDSYITIGSSDRYGSMEITQSSNNLISMVNSNPIVLSPGDTIDLMGNLKLIVADNSSVLRFAPSVEETGIFDVRGTIYPVTSEWTPLNFGLDIGSSNIGFFYDMKRDIGTETLTINEISGNTIQNGGLVYSTSPEEISFEYSPFGSYQVIGFMADKYFAGYTANTNPPNPTDSIEPISAISQGQLHKILTDEDTQHVLSVGSTLSLKEGYVLKAEEIDLTSRQMLMSLLKDGKKVDTIPLSPNQTYVFTKTVGSVSNLPILIIRFENVFAGSELQAAFIRGIFQISESMTPVRTGDSYGQMEITSVSPGGIIMDNPGYIGLSRGNSVDLMGNIKFKVADSDVVRFYPYVTVVPAMISSQLVIDVPEKATAGDVITITVTAGGSAVEGASVVFGSATGLTDTSGRFNYSLPRSLNGTYNITATLLGYQKGTKSIEVAGYVEKMLSIEAPAQANQLENIIIRVSNQDIPIEGADVKFDNVSIGSTDNAGFLNYTLEKSGTHTISASKDGYLTVGRDIDVRAPFSDFRAIDINITPDILMTGETAVIISNITNAGNMKDTLPVVLVVNSTEVDSKLITLAPAETKEVDFMYNSTLPAGNYTVEIIGQKSLIRIEQKITTPAYEAVSTIGVLLVMALILRRRNS
ncbi:MAG: S-layer protein domain-containing protein [Candidatus Methanoperedens sp.]|nr:S-layer protein domain-containing protein [Candidatus Methanoperedens sp.]